MVKFGIVFVAEALITYVSAFVVHVWQCSFNSSCPDFRHVMLKCMVHTPCFKSEPSSHCTRYICRVAENSMYTRSVCQILCQFAKIYRVFVWLSATLDMCFSACLGMGTHFR